MSATKDNETLLSNQSLPLEFRRLVCARRIEEGKIVGRLSGLVPGRPQDDLICPTLVVRQLVVPAFAGATASAS